MLNPVDVERRFLHVQHLLEGHLSFRQQWLLVAEFLESIIGHFETYDTHCEQLVAQLPIFSNPLSISGTDPVKFESIIVLLDKLERSLPAIEEIGNYKEAKESLVVATAFLFVCLSEWALADRVINAKADRSSTLGLSGEEYIQKLKESEEYASIDAFRMRVNGINEWWETANRIRDNSLYVPVVEIGDTVPMQGRLRLLSATVIRQNRQKDIFRSSYSVIGAEGSDAGLSPVVQETVRDLLDSSHPKLYEQYFEVQFDYKLSYGVQKGRSAELASSLTAYTAILGFTKSRERYTITQPIAVSGRLKKGSEIMAVDEKGVEPKVRAAFFSWVKLMVIPEDQKQAFIDQRNKLKDTYPMKELKIVGLDEPEAFFYDRRLSDHINDSKPVHTAKQLWAKKFSVAGVVIILLLLTTVGRLMYGPIDKNPVIGIFEGDKLKLYNTNEILITSFEVGDTNRLYREINNSNNTHPHVQFFDLNKDGINEVFWHQISYDEISDDNRLMAWSVTGDSLLWETGLTFNVNYPNKSEIIENQYTVREFLITNNSVGHPKIVANTSMLTYFPTLILMIDVFTGAIEKKYSHPGYFRDMELFDVTGDETTEIIATGVNNAFRAAVISILELDQLQGRAPSNEEYMVEGFEPTNHIHYILVPKTIIGENHGASSRFNSGSQIDILPSDTLINFYVTDSQTPIDDSQYLPMIVVTMNQKFDPLGIGTDDRYDLLSRRLYEEKQIPFIPGFEYFDTFKDSLMYWDGEKGKFSRTK